MKKQPVWIIELQKMMGKRSVWSVKERIGNLLCCTAFSFFLGFFFYRRLWMGIFLLPCGYFFLRYMYTKAEKKRGDQIRAQFGQVLESLMANLKAGYSPENAFRETTLERIRLYGENRILTKELKRLCISMKQAVPLESALFEFSKELDVEEIREFAELFAVAKRTGGNLTGILKETISLIQEKIAVQREVSVLISGKRTEAMVMIAVPFGLITYITATSPGYFDVLYEPGFGTLVMSICIALYGLAVYLCVRICDIRV